MPYATLPWPQGADPTAVCAAAGETNPAERMYYGGTLYIYGADQAAATAALAATPPDTATPARKAANAVIEAQIVALEQTQHRAVREQLLGVAGATARLQAIDTAIAALRARRQ